MISLPEYIIKLSVSLSVLYIFYRIVLHRLTFYQWNRVYLLSYSLLSFVLPSINIGPWMEKQGIEAGTLEKIPTLGNYYLKHPDVNNSLTLNQWVLILLLAGIVVFSGRLLVGYLSLKRIRKNAVLCHDDKEIRLFNTKEMIGPFSFGRAIYLNTQLHSDDELQRIIQHEMVHVKQKHIIDLVAGELLCVVNWYNPFAWLIRNAIRQNLEFIADRNVLAKGYDKKAYQYLLLKVIGVPQYSVANNFNLPDLKKRIIMMNKMKSASLHLTRFLFALPLLCIVLLAFRNGNRQPGESEHRIIPVQEFTEGRMPAGADTIPASAPANSGTVKAQAGNKENAGKHKYQVSIADDNGERIVIVRNNKKHEIVKAIPLNDWNLKKEKNEKRYGPISGSDFQSRRPEIQIRGLGSAQPLYLVDGTEQNSAFKISSLDVSDIQSISVSKGADAVDRYGKKGANGVVSIELKPKAKDSLDKRAP